MSFLYKFFIAFTLPSLALSEHNILINELNIDEGWIELRSLEAAPYDLNTNGVGLQIYEIPSAGDLVSIINSLPGTIPANGVIKFDINRGTNERKKRSAGGTIAIQISSDSTKLVYLYKNNYDSLDSLVFQTTPYPSPTSFSSFAPQWNNKYLTYQSGKVFVRIGDNKKTPEDWELRTVGTPDAPNGVSGDPHFIQTIIDANSKEMHKICYDITGKSGDEIYILEDKLTNSKVTGVLLNDYYLHAIKIYHNDRLYNFKVDEVNLENGKKLLWKNNFSFQDDSKSLDFSISGENIFLTIKNNRNDKFIVNIKRSTNPLIGKYLDVSFSDIFTKHKRYNGLLGHIGKQSITFLDQIQTGQFGIIKVNNQTIAAELQKRNQISCWFVSFKSIIAPKLRKHFIIENSEI